MEQNGCINGVIQDDTKTAMAERSHGGARPGSGAGQREQHAAQAVAGGQADPRGAAGEVRGGGGDEPAAYLPPAGKLRSTDGSAEPRSARYEIHFTHSIILSTPAQEAAQIAALKRLIQTIEKL